MSDYQRIEKIIRFLDEHYLEQPQLPDLARIVGISEFHFLRLFKRWAGITPKDFVKFLTLNHAKKLLLESRDLLSTSHQSGLSGPGRLHDLFVSIEAVTPGEYKSRGKGITIEYGYHDGPFGKFLIGITPRGVCFLSFSCDLQELREKWENALVKKNQRSTALIAKNLFHPGIEQKTPVLLMGTPFQLKVWEALLNIPEGHLLSYSDMARIIASPKSARAVGTAIGENAIAFLIPCHRVIRESGNFSHYRWDPVRKKAILIWESTRKKKF